MKREVSFGDTTMYRSIETGDEQVVEVFVDNENVGELYKEGEMIEWAGNGTIEKITNNTSGGIANRSLAALKKEVVKAIHENVPNDGSNIHEYT